MTDQSFEEFLGQQRPRVATAFVNGDSEPLREISATADPATFYGPGGGIEHGSAHVLAGNEKAAKQFQRGGTVPMTLRVTEIFRREKGAWKLMHRHADPLTEAKKG